MTAQPSSGFTISDIRRIIIGLMLIILLGALDQTIVSVSLPQMAHDLGSVSMLAWVVSGYLVASTVSTPVYGKLGDLYGRRMLLSIAVVIFLIASVGCALAQTMPMLVLARVLQGIGGGGLISSAQAIIGDVVPLRERGRYQGYISVVYAVASVGGPVLGGYLTHLLSWRWVFWINLPLGVVALWTARRALKSLPVPGVKLPVDYFGAILLTTGLSLLLVAITRVGQGVALLSPDTLWLMAVSVVLLMVFVRQEHRTAEPLIPLGLFKIRTVWIGCTILFISFFQVVSLSVLVPFGMQTLDGIGPDAAALRLIAFSLAVPAGAFTGGRWMMHTGRYKPLQVTGTALLPLATLILAYLGPHANFANSAVLALAGFSIGMTMPTSLVAVQNAVPQKNIGIATAMTALFRSMGGAIGVAILSSILFALLHGGGTTTGIEAGIQNAVSSDPAHASFAFRVTLLCSALIAAAAHVLAWMIPENTLRTGSQAAAKKTEEKIS
ncbi:MDR family MFS transporter [Noviherbaspirillum massiliense]|uniref:MDR family MFS transporter n=1 Tax=Noviherbaspirillum massiliense TaxID=1465823 RepID=UPI000370804D|nr:MDR family MFS transporter [Noviherbaspirillum massiliense]